ncbi:MAG: 6-pyruvoyl trahydropterin synthase family protein [Bacteroidota bacterium]
MNTIRISKEFTFEMAHALEGHDGKCANIHGHSYVLTVTVTGQPISDPNSPKLGMVIDYVDLKKIVKEEIVDSHDHAVLLKDTHAIGIEEKYKLLKLIRTTYQPTCENMIADFAQKIIKRLPSHVKLHSLRLRETATSYAEWFAEDN